MQPVVNMAGDKPAYLGPWFFPDFSSAVIIGGVVIIAILAQNPVLLTVPTSSKLFSASDFLFSFAILHSSGVFFHPRSSKYCVLDYSSGS